MTLFDELQESLLEAIAIERGQIPMVERKGMPAPTFVAESVADLVNFKANDFHAEQMRSS